MKIMRMGDPHIKPTNIDEGEELMHFFNDLILEHKPDRVEILGDLFHTHAVVRLEVLQFWDNWLDVLLSHEDVEFVILVGNHDMTGDYNSNYSALSIFRHMRKRNLKIVELPRVEGFVGYMPYFHNHAEFVELANGLKKHGAKILVCHQTIAGSKYESGIYAPDGIDPKLLDYDLIISGHIHAAQIIENDGQTVVYPGTAKWDTSADANHSKGIYLYHHDDETGKITKTEAFSTEKVVTPYFSFTWREGEAMPEIPATGKVSMELIGSSNWVMQNKSLLKGHMSVKTKITDKANQKKRETGRGLEDFVKNIYVTSMDRVQLIAKMKELGLV